jgi:hypothetical protein
VILAPSRKLWTPWDWLTKFTEGKIQREPGGKIKRNESGKLIRNNNVDNTCCCLETECDYYRVRRCCDDAYVDFAVAAADLPQLPFTFTYDDLGAGGGECWYVNGKSQCTDAVTYPVITIPDDVTEYDDCDDCRGTCLDCTSATTCPTCSTCDSLTPDAFTVSVSGVSVLNTCTVVQVFCGFGTFFLHATASSYSGTVTMTQTSSCIWQYTQTGGLTLKYYNGSCVEVGTYSQDLIFVLNLATGFSINPANPTGSCTADSYPLFSANISDFDCCGRNSLSNLRTATPGGGEQHVGWGGQAVITPC